MTTQHFALRSAASSTISESGSRVAIYLSALSSGLVAIGPPVRRLVLPAS